MGSVRNHSVTLIELFDSFEKRGQPDALIGPFVLSVLISYTFGVYKF
jgi:hypothetical protein